MQVRRKTCTFQIIVQVQDPCSTKHKLLDQITGRSEESNNNDTEITKTPTLQDAHKERQNQLTNPNDLYIEDKHGHTG